MDINVVNISFDEYKAYTNKAVDEFISDFQQLSLSKLFLNIKHSNDTKTVKSNFFRSFEMSLDDIHSNNLFSNVKNFIIESIYNYLNNHYSPSEISFEELLIILNKKEELNYVFCDNGVASKLEEEYPKLIKANEHLQTNSDFFLKGYDFIKDFPEGVCLFDPNLFIIEVNVKPTTLDLSEEDVGKDLGRDPISLCVGININLYNKVKYYKVG